VEVKDYFLKGRKGANKERNLSGGLVPPKKIKEKWEFAPLRNQI